MKVMEDGVVIVNKTLDCTHDDIYNLYDFHVEKFKANFEVKERSHYALKIVSE